MAASRADRERAEVRSIEHESHLTIAQAHFEAWFTTWQIRFLACKAFSLLLRPILIDQDRD